MRRGLRWRWIAIVGLIAVVAVGMCLSVVSTSGPRHGLAKVRPVSPAAGAASSASTPSGDTSGVSSGTGRSLGSFGVQSAAIIAENAKPGSSDWKIAGTPATGYVQGWANRTYAQVGDAVTLYVSTTAPQFHVVAYRMGYYGGTGAREVWSSPDIAGRIQPACRLVDPVTINMVSCTNWTASLTMAVTSDFVQGDYLLKFVGSGGEQSYAPLTVWDPASTATYLFETHSMTSAAWNDYGGFSFYTGKGACPAGAPSYPVCNRARVSSFDRPYLDGHGSGDFLYNEYPLLQFMEQHGLDVAYASDVALDADPGVMLDHKALLSLGHDETWTYAERKGAVAAAAKGVNIAFFSAAAIVRHARLQPSVIGPDREVVEYRDSNEDPIHNDPAQTTGNTWAVAPTDWPHERVHRPAVQRLLAPGLTERPVRGARRDRMDLQGHRPEGRIGDT